MIATRFSFSAPYFRVRSSFVFFKNKIRFFGEIMGNCISGSKHTHASGRYGNTSSGVQSYASSPSATPQRHDRGQLSELARRSRSSVTQPASRSGWMAVLQGIQLPRPLDSRLTGAMGALGSIYQQSPEFRAVADQVVAEGGGQIRIATNNDSPAYTDVLQRIIYIAPSTLNNSGDGDGPSLVSALAVEINNLSRAQSANEVAWLADQGGLNARSFATEYERIEYGSAQSHAQVFQEAYSAMEQHGQANHPERWFSERNAQGGIEATFSSFEDYLETQHETGHTQVYEDRFREEYQRD